MEDSLHVLAEMSVFWGVPGTRVRVSRFRESNYAIRSETSALLINLVRPALGSADPGHKTTNKWPIFLSLRFICYKTAASLPKYLTAFGFLGQAARLAWWWRSVGLPLSPETVEEEKGRKEGRSAGIGEERGRIL